MIRRSVVGGIVLASLVGVVPATSAQEPVPPAPVVSTAGRFTERDIESSAPITGEFSRRNQNRRVRATVVLSGRPVAAAEARAERRGVPFDEPGTESAVIAGQQTVLPKLRAAGARVKHTMHTAINAAVVTVRVSDLEELAAVPGVVKVHVSRTVRLANGPSATFTGVPSVWDNDGLTGAGQTIGIIDDGIDYYHADFGGSGDTADYTADDPTVIEPGTFPTAKVIGGYDFVGDNYDADADAPGESATPVPDDDPLACGHHGTHVAGTAAGQGVLDDGSTFTGPYDVDTLTTHAFEVAPGSAPEASIRMYKVFGCDGTANDDVILAAIDMAVADEVNVISMSLGGTWGSPNDPIGLALDNASAAGILSVVSAGNDGPNAYLVGGPSTADSVLSVAAMDVSSPTLPGVDISGDVTSVAQNSNEYDFDTNGSVTGELVDVGLGCDVADYAVAVGKIAVAHRGVCGRTVRAVNATTAGALAVVFINNADSLPPLEGVIPGADVPFVGVSLADAALFTDGLVVTLAGGATIPNPAFANYASFTSNGPRLDSSAKPDITAPGVSILSAGVGTGTGGILLSGTSMATPHTSGIAVLVRQAHPGWTPAQVKGALMSSADPTGVVDASVLRGGAGAVVAPDAVRAKATITTADGKNNLSFGFAQLSGPLDARRRITITNSSSSSVTYDMSSDVGDLGTQVTVSFNPSVVTVGPGRSVKVTVRLQLADPENLPDAGMSDGGALQTISGLVWATPRTTSPGIAALKTPLLLVPYGLSSIDSSGSQSGPGSGSGRPVVDTITVVNNGVREGTYDTYQWMISDPKGDIALTGQNIPDIRDVGIQQFPLSPTDDLVVVLVNTFGRTPTPSTGEYRVFIDTSGDLVSDYVLLGIDNGVLTSGAPDGLMQSVLVELATNTVVDAWDAFAPANGSVVQLPFRLSKLPTTHPWRIRVQGWSVTATAVPDVTTAGYYDPLNPAVSAGDFGNVAPGASASIPVTVASAAATAQGTLGWLVVSVDDRAGREADRVVLKVRPSAKQRR